MTRLARDELRTVLVDFNRTDETDPDGTVVDAFESHAAVAPDAPALIFGDDVVTYGELDARSALMACHLAHRGVGAEVVVALCLTRSPDMIAALLAVWRAGGAYLPLDPDLPAERLAFMLDDGGAAMVVTDAASQARLPATGVEVVALEALAASPAPGGQPAGPGMDDLAYIIYTSGSTGVPKGVLIPHDNVAQRALTFERRYGVGPGDVLNQLATLSFDTSVEEVVSALAHGAALVVRGPENWTPDDLERLVVEHGITVLDLPTAYWGEIARWGAARGSLGAIGRVRCAVVGGEAMRAETARVWLELAEGRLVNGYGPTEATIVAAVGEVALPVGSSVSIGRPVVNARAYVLDDHLHPVLIGVVGELCVGGAGVARGYRNRPGLTAERFVPDPYADRPGARMYRTGDLAQWRADGTLDFLGRVDDQVKIRGYRIELGEIEAHLAAHPDVADVAVAAREDRPGDRRLVAYVVPRDVAPDLHGLRIFMHERLPPYMVPSAFVVLDGLPLTSSGKVDRRALPAPEGRPDLGEMIAPRTPAEEYIAEVWCEVLGLDELGVEDNFFDLGGHSLLATQVISRLRAAYGVDVDLSALFEGPTIESMALAVEGLIIDQVVAEG